MQKYSKFHPSEPTKHSKMTKMWTNHFELDLNLNQIIYVIQVKTTIPGSDKMKNFESLIQSELVAIKENIKCSFYFTGSLIYSLEPLTEDSISFPFQTRKEFVFTLSKTPQSFTIKDIFALKDKQPEIIKFLNVVLKSKMEAIGYRNFGKQASFFPANVKPKLLSDGVSVLQGFKLNIDSHLDQKFRLNIDTCFRIASIKNIFQEYTEFVNSSDDKDSARARFISENIIGKSFSVLNDLNRMVKIHGGMDNKMKLSSPCTIDPKFPSMKEFFEDRFKVKLTLLNQFILYNERAQKKPSDKCPQDTLPERFYYPSEVMFALGLKDSQKKRGSQIMSELSEITKLTPNNRKSMILNFAKSLKSICSDAINLSLSQTPKVALESKVMSFPSCEFRNKKFIQPTDGNIWINAELISKPSLKRWSIIYESNDEYVDELFDKLTKTMDIYGISYDKDPYMIKMKRDAKMSDFSSAIDEVKEEGNDFILLLLSKHSGDTLYKRIKEYCDLKVRILTQVSLVNFKNVSKKGYADKLVMQMAAKLGFPLWHVEKPAGFRPKDAITMLIGADVYHSKGKESVSAVIGTTNQDFSKYCSLSNVQLRRGQEIMDNVAEMVVECIQEFKATNKFLPEKILFFRDGVGDQMINLVKEHEISKIKEMLETKFPGQVPKLTMVLVTKRISDKFLRETSGTEVSNPSSGTIISSPAIIKKSLEFFMIAQNVHEKQGTSTPTRYQVLINECGYTELELHEITYFQTFNYYNWSGAVKVPAVCQYAHKLAYHIGENYRKQNKYMKTNLYYL